ncbi:unnamed protein product [Owenia fusiformis]|uniref:EGF-like domain-containing protein n=1 Tax=Owenia fusiformis TaxID=6347 RepID=A0A8S4PWB4_OWEFU|nr:unnamed protein product [Owenia fusiformis]
MPCQNNGICTDEIDGYKCECWDGYTGSYCETDIDECAQDPCHNNGTCTDEINSYTCECSAGYTGVNCKDKGKCDSAPCQNEGTCIDKINSYICKCKTGYAGVNCTVTVGKLKKKPIVSKRQLQSAVIRDLAVTSSGHIVATNWIATTRIYDSDYGLIKDIDRQFDHVTVTSDGQLAFTNSLKFINFYTADGTYMRTIKVNMSAAHLRGITSLSTGQFVVCDLETRTIYIVDQLTGDATPFSAFGTFRDPYYVTTNSKGDIIVSESADGFIKGLDRAGNEIFTYAKPGRIYGKKLFDPDGVCTDTMDYIVVASSSNHRVDLLTPEGYGSDVIMYCDWIKQHFLNR